MSIVSFLIKQDKAELWKRKMTITSVAVATTRFLFGMCNCTLDNDVGTNDISHVLVILHICGLAHVRSHVSTDMDCFIYSRIL